MISFKYEYLSSIINYQTNVINLYYFKIVYYYVVTIIIYHK